MNLSTLSRFFVNLKQRLLLSHRGTAVARNLIEPLEPRMLLSAAVMTDSAIDEPTSPALIAEPSSDATATGMTALAQEMFLGIGELNAAAPGGFSGFEAGTLYTRYGGPSAEPTVDGYSADPHRATVRPYWDLTAPQYADAADGGMISGWFYFNEFVGAQQGSNIAAFLAGGHTASNTKYFTLGLDANGALKANAWQSGDIDMGVTLERFKWYWFSVAWDVELGQWSTRFYMAQQGDAAATELHRTNTKSTMSQPMDRVYVQNAPVGGAAVYGGRIGAAQLHAINSFDDVALPENVHLMPESTRRTWWINPVSGDDNHTGAGADAAWRSVEKLKAELAYAGLFGSNDGMDTGDILRIDTRDAPLVMSTNLVLGRNMDGIEITSWNDQDKASLEAFKLLDGGFTRPDPVNLPNVWSTTDTDIAVVMWQDRRWMHHPTGATFDSVKASLQDTAGSFWTDGSTLFFHPFDSTDPNTDGSTYERSYTYDSTTTGVVVLANHDYHLHHLSIGGFSLINNSNKPINRGVLINEQTAGGTAKVNDVYLYYGGKHVLSWGSMEDDAVLTFENIVVEQGPAVEWNVPGGSQTVFVVGPITGTGLHYTFRNVHSYHNAGKVGSTTGASDIDQPAFISHNGGSGQQIASLAIEQSSFDTALGFNGTNIEAGGLRITDTTITGGLGVNTVGTRIERSQIDGPLSVGSTGSVTVRDSVLTFTHNFANAPARVQGMVDIQHTTIDARGTVTPTSAPHSLFSRQGLLWWTFQSNVVLFDADAPFTLIDQISPGDRINSNHNVFQRGTTGHFARRYHGADLSFEQWQARGHDPDSVVASDAGLDAQRRPQANSPVVGMAAARLDATDFTGRMFAVRSDAGALEFARTGDVDGDGQIDATDIDLLYEAIHTDAFDPWHDLNNDGQATQADMDVLLHDILNTVRGDANLDGTVDAVDLAVIAANWQLGDRGWAAGDFDGDRVVNIFDLSLLAANWQYKRD